MDVEVKVEDEDDDFVKKELEGGKEPSMDFNQSS